MLNDGVLRLRALEPTDLDLLTKWENDTSLWSATDTVSPLSRAALWRYLQDDVGDFYRQGELRLVAELVDTGEAVGMVDLRDYSALNNRAELGLTIAAAHRGKGLSERALRLTLDYAVNHLGLHQVYAIVPADNAASRAMLAACGFEPGGVLRQWVRRGRGYRDAELWQYLPPIKGVKG